MMHRSVARYALRGLFLFSIFAGHASAPCEQSTSQIHEKSKKYIKHGIEERVTFFSRESVDSEKLLERHGVLIKRANAKAVVMFCHGFMCRQEDVSIFDLIFKKYTTFRFNFRAHGKHSADQTCTFGRNEAYDVLAAARFLKEHPDLKDVPLIIYGFSMGAVATIIAGELDAHLCDAMILDCPFDSSDKLLERALNKVKISLFGYEMGLPGTLKTYAYSPYIQTALKMILKSMAHVDSTQVNTYLHPVYPEEAIKYIKCPVFIIGCTNDDKAPEPAVRSIYQGAGGYKRLWIDDEAQRHFDVIFVKLHEYSHRLNKFIREVVDGSYAKKPSEKVTKKF